MDTIGLDPGLSGALAVLDHAGALVAVQGKRCWRKYTTKHGEEKGTLAVLVGKVNMLVPAGALAAIPGDPHGSGGPS